MSKPTTTGVRKLSVKEALKKLGIPVSKLDSLVTEGALTVIYLSSGKRPNRYFLEDEIEIFNREIVRGWEPCCESMRGFRRTWGRA